MSVTFKFSDKPLVDKLELLPVHKGQCHCGRVKFTVNIGESLEQPMRCNCSLCKRRGVVMGFVELEDFHIDEGEELLTLYQFNTNVAKHYFCSRCGVYTHHQRRSVPAQYAFNLACLDGVEPYTLANVPVIDGAGGHPSDEKK